MSPDGGSYPPDHHEQLHTWSWIDQTESGPGQIRVENRVKAIKRIGLGLLPSKSWQMGFCFRSWALTSGEAGQSLVDAGVLVAGVGQGGDAQDGGEPMGAGAGDVVPATRADR